MGEPQRSPFIFRSATVESMRCGFLRIGEAQQEGPKELLWPRKPQPQKPGGEETGTTSVQLFWCCFPGHPRCDDDEDKDDDDDEWSDLVVSPSKVHRLSHILYMKEKETLVSYL